MLRNRQFDSWAGVCAFTILTLACCLAGGASERTLERQLLRHAPQILDKLREDGCKSVGVLKFRIQRAGGRPTDSAGTLNSFLAERLEVALALANPVDPERQMKILRDASGVATQLEGASHLSDPGRSRLFSSTYPVAWQSPQVEADALVTGLAQIAADNKSFRLGIMAVTPTSPLRTLLPPFDVETDGAILHELGESFQLRGGPGSTSSEQDPAFLARQVRQDPEQQFPLQNNTTVSLLFFYDGNPISLEFRDGEAWIPEPREGQQVTLQLERMDTRDRLLGAVLKVNGENTIYRQQRRDFDCTKWVLEPASGPITIYGFQMEDNENVEKFRVVSRAESKGLEMYYGPDVGTITLTLFQEATDETPPELAEHGMDLLDDYAPDVLAIAAASFPEQPPRNAEALKSQLLRPAGDSTRGLILSGETMRRPVRKVEYNWDPQPIFSAVIRYYRPQTP
jgi:hypothetical protein